ncbi:uncharacterized protein LOC141906838 [Tubulanus polymorphus]|uniref:uncharacterized protein LOC141906838 n=1 Tax=Tubulanus polymorphus TaxID=672921 RepID=UPI003DA2FF13
MLDEILEELGMGSLIPIFRENKIELNDIPLLTDADFSRLGVTAVGDRLRLRHKCRSTEHEWDSTNSSINGSAGILNRLRTSLKKNSKATSKLNKKGSTGPESKLENKNAFKNSRRIKVGWKHYNCSKKCFELVPQSKGGGSHPIDVDKCLTKTELHRICCKLFLPSGKSIAKQLRLKDLDIFLANFTGMELPDTLSSGEQFTVNGYISQHCSLTQVPRIYLHTKNIDSDDMDDSTQL